MGAFAYAPDFKKHIENFSKRHESSLEYIKTTKMFLSTMLGISEEKISETEEDKCLLASREFYKENTQDNDAWLAFVSTCFIRLDNDLVASQVLRRSTTLRISMMPLDSGLE